MAFENLRTQAQVRTAGYAGEIDEGLRQHMLRVYNYMTSGLVVTGLVAWVMFTQSFVTQGGEVVGLTGLGMAVYGSPLKWLVMLAPLGFVMALSFGINRMSFGTLQIVFWAFAATMGISLATIFATFTGGSIARVFFITAGTFAGMSLWGYTTKRDLSGMGSFLMMGLIGIIIASLVNLFIGSSAIQFAVSVLGVLIFVGLTAYDTQRIKNDYLEHRSHGEGLGKLAIMGAVSLYLDFINLFMMLLSLFGNRQ
ncbi:MAG: Bax inhibitor-1/YccA family protein [Alphaproteobacteria bacterium]|nr:Bax inhibitor-1/YccA family protein [Alphaproteobacteria bacterium]